MKSILQRTLLPCKYRDFCSYSGIIYFSLKFHCTFSFVLMSYLGMSKLILGVVHVN
uniref:Uncharacterized protein n=1 Tax=Anguilla anguilla TaxID=7936 RepID=A0A0E9P8F4_ANGAN